MDRASKIRVDSWCKKLSEIISIQEWKKNRNLYAILLLNMLINHRLEEPFNKISKEEELPIIPKTFVNSKLTPKFWKCAKKFLNLNSNHFKKIYQEIKNDKKTKNQNKEENNNIKFENQLILDNINENKNQNQDEKNINDYDNLNANLDNVNLDYIKLEDLKEIAEQMQNELNEKKIIISQQREEKIKLENRIAKLEEMLSSIFSLDK